MKKVGIMGGTFNPIHNGHLLIAENAYDQLQLDEVRFIPTGKSPHKQHQTVTDGVHRMRMVELAIADHAGFVADDRELRTESLSYSYVTLEQLHQEQPQWELYFIMGGDSLRDFKTWRNPERICACASLAVAVRDACDVKQLQLYAEELKQLYQAKVYLLQTPNLSVNSSEIRARVAAGQTIRYQVPEPVRGYVREHSLYETVDKGTDGYE